MPAAGPVSGGFGLCSTADRADVDFPSKMNPSSPKVMAEPSRCPRARPQDPKTARTDYRETVDVRQKDEPGTALGS